MGELNKENEMRRFNNFNELKSHFTANTKRAPHAKEDIVLVDTKLRREVLTGDEGVKFPLDGRIRSVIFKSAGGGVWECSLEEIN